MLTEARAHLREGVRNILLQAPTGSGKTILAAYMIKSAADKGMTAWFICHRRELIDQTSRTFTNFGVKHAITGAGYPRDLSRNIQICGVQSLVNRYTTIAPPNLIVWDEAHHIVAGTWSKIFNTYPGAMHIGLSATPQRLDGAGLGGWFSHIVRGPEITSLISEGYLSDYKLFQPPNNVNVASIRHVAGDYNKSDLEDALNKSTITGDAVVHYKKDAINKQAVMFHVSIQRSIDAVQQFKNSGIRAEHIDGKAPKQLRDEAMYRFRSGETKILSNVDLFSEGVDVPSIECVIDCAPTMSLTRCMQRWGRALRPVEGKKYAIILDHAGNSQRHGLPDDEREWTLDSKKITKRGEASQVHIKTCTSCYRVVKAGATICECGNTFHVKPREVVEVDAELREVTIRNWRDFSDSDESIIQLSKLIGFREFDNSISWSRYKSQVIVKAKALERARNDEKLIEKRKEQSSCKDIDQLLNLAKSRNYKHPLIWAKKVMEGRGKR